MSAYVVDESTIDRILSFLHTREAGSDIYFSGPIRYHLTNAGYQISFTEHLERLGQDLLDLNIEAVQQRYPNDWQVMVASDRYAYHRIGTPNPFQAVKSLDCLIYQCSEGNVPETPLYRTLCEIRDAIYRGIVQRMPEYEKADWA